MKLCKKCGNSHDKIQCPACKSIAKKKWYENNKERVKAYSEAYRATGKHKDNQRRYVKKLRDSGIAVPSCDRKYFAEYYEKNKERIAIRVSEYIKNNRDVATTARHNYRARKRNQTGKISAERIRSLLLLQRKMCAVCGSPLGDNYHVDHIMPLALGGKHDDSNLQLLHQSCNNQKHAKHPIDFMQEKGFLL